MTAAPGSRRWPDPKVLAESAGMWAGHYALPITALSAAVGIAATVTGRPDGVLASYSAMVMVAAFVCYLWFHMTRLCERCAAASPLDPQAAVDRWHPALRFFHKGHMFGVAVLFGVYTFALRPLMPGGWRTAPDIASSAWFIVFMLTAWRHGKLAAWCPWCHWGHGGDEEVSPEVPDPALSK